MIGTRALGLAAVGAMLLIAAPVERAEAVSLINPGAAATVQQDARQQMTTEVRWHGHHHHWGGWHRHRHWGRWHHRRHWGWHHRRHWGWHHHRHWHHHHRHW